MLDASAVLEVLLRTDRAEAVMTRALDSNDRVHVPQLLDIEVTHVLRRLVLLRQLTAERGGIALDDLASLVVERHGHEALVHRIWELRESLTAYDAAYVALAEALQAPLITCDAKLAAANGHRATVELVD